MLLNATPPLHQNCGERFVRFFALAAVCGVKNELWHGGKATTCPKFGSEPNARRNLVLEAAAWQAGWGNQLNAPLNSNFVLNKDIRELAQTGPKSRSAFNLGR